MQIDNSIDMEAYERYCSIKEDPILDYGRYRNFKISELSLDYLRWAIEVFTPESTISMKSKQNFHYWLNVFIEELLRRGITDLHTFCRSEIQGRAELLKKEEARFKVEGFYWLKKPTIEEYLYHLSIPF